MKDQDYIRKAVELADGWKWHNEFAILFEHENSLIQGESGWSELYFRGRNNPTKIILDAIAAQLVRQVDANGGNLVVVKQASTTILGANDPPIFKHVSYGDERTMHTIKAIVDSGVLK